jgi:alkylhydroperoxidase/carboxymuconolactone decarboxylase family protein YurZ
MADQRHQQVLNDLHPQYTALRNRIRNVYRGFAQLSRAAFAPGNLDRSVKELIALAIGVTFLVHGGPHRLRCARLHRLLRILRR